MFRRQPIILREQHTEYVTREVNVHRAPTDESVALLREMEEEADSRRLLAFKIESNEFHGVVVAENMPWNMEVRARCRCKLNGKELIAEAVVSTATIANASAHKMELAKKLRDDLAEKIANEIIGNMLSRPFEEAFGR